MLLSIFVLNENNDSVVFSLLHPYWFEILKRLPWGFLFVYGSGSAQAWYRSCILRVYAFIYAGIVAFFIRDTYSIFTEV